MCRRPVKEITDTPKVVFERRRKGQAPKEVRRAVHSTLPAMFAVHVTALNEQVVHNPSTLEKVQPGKEKEDSEELQRASSAKARGGGGGSKRGAGSRGQKSAAGAKKGAAAKKSTQTKRAAPKKTAAAKKPTARSTRAGKGPASKAGSRSSKRT